MRGEIIAAIKKKDTAQWMDVDDAKQSLLVAGFDALALDSHLAFRQSELGFVLDYPTVQSVRLTLHAARV
jgi:hypothetical protein